jgi:hypothetical protein
MKPQVKSKAPPPIDPLRGSVRPTPSESFEEFLMRQESERAAIELAFEKAEQERKRLIEQGRENFTIKSGTLQELFDECKRASPPWVNADLAYAAKVNARTLRRHLKGCSISLDVKEKYEAAFTEKLGYRVRLVPV